MWNTKCQLFNIVWSLSKAKNRIRKSWIIENRWAKSTNTYWKNIKLFLCSSENSFIMHMRKYNVLVIQTSTLMHTAVLRWNSSTFKTGTHCTITNTTPTHQHPSPHPLSLSLTNTHHHIHSLSHSPIPITTPSHSRTNTHHHTHSLTNAYNHTHSLTHDTHHHTYSLTYPCLWLSFHFCPVSDTTQQLQAETNHMAM